MTALTPPTLSALCVVHNGEALLEDCLASVAFADEIVVVLDRCTDRSKAIAQAHGAVLVEGGWEIEGPRRNAGLDACTKDYIFEIDADERVTPALQAEVRAILGARPQGGVFIPFDNRIGGQPITFGWGAYNGVGGKRCIFPRGAKRWGAGRLHPSITQPEEVARSTARMVHLVYDDIPHMYQRLLRYCRLAAEDMVEADTIPSVFTTTRRVFSRFFKAYVQRKGHKEGVYGAALAVYSGLYPLLSHLMAAEMRRKKFKA
jgi:glycosyltransferase involved in cell wall biosynthesis